VPPHTVTSYAAASPSSSNIVQRGPQPDVLRCRQCGLETFVGELGAGQFVLLDAAPMSTASGYMPIGGGRAAPKFAPAAARSPAFRPHWPSCTRVAPWMRAFEHPPSEVSRTRR
jgi:hypothetical protein